MRTTTTTIQCDHCEDVLTDAEVAGVVTISPDVLAIAGGRRFDLCAVCMPLLGEFLGVGGDE